MGEPTILVVDDTDRVRAITADILGGAGFKVREARDGVEALALANDAPDLIVLDVRMPGMDGFDVCRRLKQTPTTAAIPVLYLSAAHRDEHDRVHGLTTGGAAYLTRPIEPSDLVSTVRTLLRLREAQQDPAHPDRLQWLFQHATDGVWIEDGAGRVIGVSPIARDVTDRKRAESAEREAEALRAVANLASTAPMLDLRASSPDAGAA